MTDAFAELVMPIFRKGIELQERLSRGEPLGLEQVKPMASAWIEEARRSALGVPGLSGSYELARYGLVAWIDEVLTESEWGRRVGSPEEILEWDLYSSRYRASLFYEHADRAEEEGDLDALETYLLGVTLGFRGKLVYDDAGLADWVNHVYRLVSAAGSVPSRPFSEDPPHQSQFGPLRGPSLLVTVSVLVSITAFATLAAYLIAVAIEFDNKNPASPESRTSAAAEVRRRKPIDLEPTSTSPRLLVAADSD